MTQIGIDICNPKRIERIYSKFGHKFLDRILSQEEKDYVLSSPKLLISRLTGRYAAKEAVAKLLRTGIGVKISFQDIIISSGQNQAPQVNLKGQAIKIAQDLGIKDISLSISHEDIMVMAVAAGVSIC